MPQATTEKAPTLLQTNGARFQIVFNHEGAEYGGVPAVVEKSNRLGNILVSEGEVVNWKFEPGHRFTFSEGELEFEIIKVEGAPTSPVGFVLVCHNDAVLYGEGKKASDAIPLDDDRQGAPRDLIVTCREIGDDTKLDGPMKPQLARKFSISLVESDPHFKFTLRALLGSLTTHFQSLGDEPIDIDRDLIIQKNAQSLRELIHATPSNKSQLYQVLVNSRNGEIIVPGVDVEPNKESLPKLQGYVNASLTTQSNGMIQLLSVSDPQNVFFLKRPTTVLEGSIPGWITSILGDSTERYNQDL